MLRRIKVSLHPHRQGGASRVRARNMEKVGGARCIFSVGDFSPRIMLTNILYALQRFPGRFFSGAMCVRFVRRQVQPLAGCSRYAVSDHAFSQDTFCTRRSVNTELTERFKDSRMARKLRFNLTPAKCIVTSVAVGRCFFFALVSFGPDKWRRKRRILERAADGILARKN